MHKDLKLSACLLLATLGLIGSCVPDAYSQTPDPVGKLQGTIVGTAQKKYALALPPVAMLGGAAATQAGEVGDVVRGDLDFSGSFELLDPNGEGRIAATQINNPKAWASVGAQYLSLLSLKLEGTIADLRVQVFETTAGELWLDRTYRGRAPDDLRRLAHRASNEILNRLTGETGIFLTRIAFVGDVGRAKEVFLMDYDGARVRQLTKTGVINLVPAWASDGKRLAFVSYLSKRPQFHLLDESGKITQLRPAGGDLNVSPDWSPDGTKLAFTSDRDGNSEIYLYDVIGGRELRLTRDAGIDTAPCWSPGGDQIAFTSDRSGSPQIYLMSADGTNLRRFTYQGQYNESAAWSPDGGRIAFMSRIEGVFQLVIHELQTGKETVITTGRGNKENPRWAGDGKHLVFSGNMDGRYSIYSIRIDGTGLRRLTQTMAAITPDWSPAQPR